MRARRVGIAPLLLAAGTLVGAATSAPAGTAAPAHAGTAASAPAGTAASAHAGTGAPARAGTAASAQAGTRISARAGAAGCARADAATRIPVRVVVVTTFEIGADTGDTAGEFQNWVERLPLPDTIAFPQGFRPLRWNRSIGVLGVVSGEGPVHMAASIEALGNDGRFDVSHAYWILAGIAGIDPNRGAVGSAAWAHDVVDGDLAYEIDAREIPPGWRTGLVPLGRSSPYGRPRPAVSSINGVNLFALDRGFVDWAYRISRARASLPDDANLRAVRARYAGFPKAQRPPAIVEGDVLAAGRFWVGARLDAWAEDWVRYWSDGQASFVMTAEEDAGFMQALTFLSQAGQVDLRRALVLRAASDYAVPPPGTDAATLLGEDATGTGLSGFGESTTDAYLAASPVVRELATHWPRYRDRVPEER